MNLQSEDKQLKLMHQWNKQKNIKIQQNPVYIAESDEKMFAGNCSTTSEGTKYPYWTARTQLQIYHWSVTLLQKKKCKSTSYFNCSTHGILCQNSKQYVHGSHVNDFEFWFSSEHGCLILVQPATWNIHLLRNCWDSE
jgi:hypothetical protein